jgi:mRNA interferase YafQ
MTATLIPTSKYRKDLKKLEARGVDLSLLDEAVDMIASGKKLPESFQKHELKGQRQGQIDVHIKPDLLLLYEPDEFGDEKVIYLRRTGTHSDLFG